MEDLPALPPVSLDDPAAALVELARQRRVLAERRQALQAELDTLCVLHTKMAAVVANRRRRLRRAAERAARQGARASSRGRGGHRGRRRGPVEVATDSDGGEDGSSSGLGEGGDDEE